MKSGMKKKRRIKIRKKWAINPKTRIKESKKAYSRKRQKARLRRTDGEIT
jgi:hypothetical protein